MAFQAVKHFIGGAVGVAPPKDVKTFKLADNEAGVAGRVYYFHATNGRITKCTGTTGIPAVVLIESVGASATGAEARGYYITPGMQFKVRPSKANGTDPGLLTDKHANFNEGCVDARFDTNGDFVDWATSPASGNIVVLQIEGHATESWVWVVFKKTIFNA